MVDLQLNFAEIAFDSFQEFDHLQGWSRVGVGIRTESQRGDDRIFNEDCDQAFLKELDQDNRDPRSTKS